MYEANKRIYISNKNHVFHTQTGTIEKCIGTDQSGHVYMVKMDDGKILKLWHYAIEVLDNQDGNGVQ